MFVAPVGDYIGLRQRWNGLCMERGIKTVIKLYKDNRLNSWRGPRNNCCDRMYFNLAAFATIVANRYLSLWWPTHIFTAMRCVLENSWLSLVTLSASWVVFIPCVYTFCFTVGGI